MSVSSNAESAYVILVNDDNTMTTTQKRRVVQRSKLVDDMWLLANPIYNGYEMKNFTVSLEYVLPVSRRYRNEILRLSEEDYNGYLKYLLPFDTTLTEEPGNIELTVTFLLVEIDADGRAIQRVRKVVGTHINIQSATAWSDIIPDDALSALDQRIIMTNAQIKALSEMSDALMSSKADNIKHDKENNTIQLTSAGKEIGNKVSLGVGTGSLEDGIPAVDFSTLSGSGSNPDDSEDNVVEF